jgi:hypothetical protein
MNRYLISFKSVNNIVFSIIVESYSFPKKYFIIEKIKKELNYCCIEILSITKLPDNWYNE